MFEPLAGKIALVTGAARGIGRAIALKLAAAGCDVAANYYNSYDEAETLCAEIRALGRRAVAIKASVGMPDSVDELFVELQQHFDRLDIVVSNAASGVLRPATEMALKHWRWCMETNALALNFLAQRAVPLMPQGGRIIAMSSLGAVARNAGLRVHRRVEGSARIAGAHARAGARAARDPRERGQRGRRRHRRPAVLSQSRGICSRRSPSARRPARP